MKSFLFHSLIFICIVQKVNAQTFQLGSWNILNLTYSHNENLSFFGEGQLRSLKFYTHFHYYEFKGGISYRVHKNVKLTLGAGSYQTYKEGGNFILPKNNDEFRIWPQLALYQPIGKLKIEQRYRAELRFTSNGYRNRFRYRLGVSYAFGKERDEYKPYQVSISNELFFTTTEPYFERNRILVALNYKPSKNTMLQLGYLHQFDYKITDETGLNFFQIGYFIEFSRKKNDPNID
ncbi:MAG: hypothetical protein RLZZ198_656 [Bacteroidota bacterium]